MLESADMTIRCVARRPKRVIAVQSARALEVTGVLTPGAEERTSTTDQAGLPLELTILVRQLSLAAVGAALDLEVADRLQDGIRRSDDLAVEIGTDAGRMYRLLRALTVLGIVEEHPGRMFKLLPLGARLRSDNPDSAAPRIRLFLRPYRCRAMAEVARAMTAGQVPVELVMGTPFFDFMDAHPDEAAIFDAAMTSFTATQIESVLHSYEFLPLHQVMDVGGGHGALLAAILEAYPGIRGTLFDLPRVLEGAARTMEAKGIRDRCELVGGSFFELVPPGADAYILRSILHDWDDEGAVRILRNVRKAIPDSGRILVIDDLIPSGLSSDLEKLIDLNMMVVLRGRERTREEVSTLFEMAGFRLARVIPIDGPVRSAIFEGFPVPLT
jgi:O-methyltransferase